MNLRDLQYIIAVAESHHFGKAAQRCFVSQPTLSGQIKKLEDELGVAIFERTNRSVEITPVGEDILTLARQMMEQADAIRQLAQAHTDPLAGPLRVGAIPTLSPYLMPLILLPLKQQHPQIKLVLSEEMTDTLLTRLRGRWPLFCRCPARHRSGARSGASPNRWAARTALCPHGAG